MSQISARREAKSNAAQQHWIAERLLDRSAFMTTHVRPTFFAEWIKWAWLRNDEDPVIQLPFGDGRRPSCLRRRARISASASGRFCGLRSWWHLVAQDAAECAVLESGGS
jgi:uncharacterized protein YbjT (DUF2867 family)